MDDGTLIAWGILGVAAGFFMIWKADWAIKVSNENRWPGTKPARPEDRRVFVVAGVVWIVVVVAFVIYGLTSG